MTCQTLNSQCRMDRDTTTVRPDSCTAVRGYHYKESRCLEVTHAVFEKRRGCYTAEARYTSGFSRIPELRNLGLSIDCITLQREDLRNHPAYRIYNVDKDGCVIDLPAGDQVALDIIIFDKKPFKVDLSSDPSYE